MTTHSKVIWSEGMFLQPQHLQQHDRYVESLVERRAGALRDHAWGWIELALDEPSLRMGRIALARARGLLPDGTPFDFPAQEEAPSALEIPVDARNERVVLALPLRRPAACETDLFGEDPQGAIRYRPAERELPDITLAAGPSALVQLGLPCFRLMLARDATDAYACVGVARVVERRADDQLVLDRDYIPPMLACAGSAVLAAQIGEIHGLLHQRAKALAARVAQPGRGGVAEIADFLLLQTVNRHEPVFRHYGLRTLLHPESLYAHCLALAGELATFSRDERRPPDYPPYRHDDLQSCFLPLAADLRRSLSMVLEQTAVPIELQDRKYGVRVAVVPDLELLRSAAFVLAVNAQMPGEALRVRFPGQVKIGPVERIRDLVNLALPGIALRALPVAPRQIPFHAGFNYFELDRGSELWKQLQQSGGLALHIAGDFPGLEIECWAIRD
ncbi:type VI secretion protein [Thauera phenylacetica B4P]|uniref:Type VI secretion protein n=1 Tax=Thauera phenylacetica B4P TaxID=1234382 RepID=N6YWN4_9RHOO|nr:type VI secretion system baseplate subunit TssK [Thauera phenylacetica]ENO95985.1 type VI secretion protein [Thauera phenylacetica B4P]